MSDMQNTLNFMYLFGMHNMNSWRLDCKYAKLTISISLLISKQIK